jgi:hypothetical protein
MIGGLEKDVRCNWTPARLAAGLGFGIGKSLFRSLLVRLATRFALPQ